MKRITRLFGLMWKYQKEVMILKVVLAILQGIIISLNVSFTKNLIDNMVDYIKKTRDLREVLISGIILGTTILVDVVFVCLNSMLDVECEKKLTNTLEPEFIEKFCKLPYKAFEDSESQNTILRASDSPYLKMRSIFVNLMMIVQMVFSIVGISVVYMKVSVILVVFILMMAGPIIWVNSKVNYWWWYLYFSQTDDVRRTDYFNDLLCAKAPLADLKVFRGIDFIVQLWRDKTNKLLQQKQEMVIKVQKLLILKSLVTFIWYALSLGFGIYAFFKLSVSYGILVAIVQSNLLVSDYIDNIANGVGNITKDIHDIDLFIDFLNMEERNEKKVMDYHFSEVSIAFENVRFKYPKTDNYVLDGVSFTVNMNENVSIVGENGAGKSTIVKLLCKLYEPTEGRITINGVDLKDISYAELHEMLGVIFQDYFRYELSLRENVAFGCLEKMNDDEKLLEAIRMSEAEDILDKCNNGIDSHLGKLEEDGVDLSGGQWQRIALSRAYISDAPMIILDEPTASLDPIAESNMYHMFIDIMKNHATIMISHRLSSSRISNKIIVLHHGKVVEQGTHDELMQMNGFYKIMFQRQANWYIEEDGYEAG